MYTYQQLLVIRSQSQDLKRVVRWRQLARHHLVVFLGGFIVPRLFNPNTMTEVIPGFHDITGAIELPDDNWFFTTDEIPDGKILTVNNNGEPVMIDIIQDN
jgi:hypothetical protein